MTGDKITRLDTARGGLPVDLALYGLSAAFAGVTALTSTLLPHRAWGSIAIFGYAVAALIALVALIVSGSVADGSPAGRDEQSLDTPTHQSAGRDGLPLNTSTHHSDGQSAADGSTPGPDAQALDTPTHQSAGRRSPRRWPAGRFLGRWPVAVGAFVAVGVLPMLVEAVERAGGRGDRAQEEVWVVEHAGARLWDTGSPYLGRAAIDALPVADRLDAYMPYQPGMSVFGLPRAIAGDAAWTDARIWFALVFVVALGWALRIGGSGPARVRALQAAAVFPVSALTLATGGDDMPVLGLCLLALAFAARRRWVATGLAVGVAGALKLFAWPVALVLIAYALLRPRADARPADGSGAVDPSAVGPARSGRVRDALLVTAGAIGLPLLALVPALVVNADALVENILRFPMGHGAVQSPAQSPFPGFLIKQHLPAGGAVVDALLVLAGVAIAVWLVKRPPRDAGSAAYVCAVGILAFILLLPASRFGYLMYPVAFVGWIPLLRTPVDAGAGRRHPDASARSAGPERRPRRRTVSR